MSADKIIHFPGDPVAGGAWHFHVEVMLVPLALWRRFAVPRPYTFWDLHVTIQDLFQWGDSFPFLFTFDHPKSGQRVQVGLSEGLDYPGKAQVLPAQEHQLGEFLRPGASAVLYSYKLGNGWSLELVCEKGTNHALVGPVCFGGAGQSPPEGLLDRNSLRDFYEQPAASVFSGSEVVFSNPAQRWRHRFGHE